MLTEKELQQIKDEAESCADEMLRPEIYPTIVHIKVKKAYIAGATKERERAKELIEVLENCKECFDKHDFPWRVEQIDAAINNYNQKREV